ncbi:MAG: Collagenase, putative [uncultured Aureispira sp.]|uniref:Collagenase, putative n=1 Tax=uncultured Aureispira sp. TaxID=1331704 RepID=A0A6S6UFH1_9BACT|nr:MAG: Collagenase, putative [uncultured Aureispira sp.]
MISVLLGAIGVLLCLQSASGGRAANNEMDRTNSPGSTGTCGIYCHGSAGLYPNTQLNVVIEDANGSVVTAYVPGQVYTLEFEVTSDGSPFGYGMQAVILDSLNMNTGDMLAVSTSETQLTRISNGREFIEHQGISNTGIFRTTWMAPPVGTGAVTIYGMGMAVNGSGTTQGDDFAAAIPVVLLESITNHTQNLQVDQSLYDVFPNPNQGAFYIKATKMEQDCFIQVFNLAGQIIYQESVTLAKNEAHQIKLNENIPGVYWVKIEQGASTQGYPIRVY